MILSRFPNISPEFDTCRVFIPCYRGKSRTIDDELFFSMEFQREIASFQKVHNDDGSVKYREDGTPEITLVWERQRADMKRSWWVKMQVFKDGLRFGEKGKINLPSICCEFSVAKWYNYTNGINRGCSLDPYEIIAPCCQVLQQLNVLKYTVFETWGAFVAYVIDNVVCRRVDLSYNFKVTDVPSAMRFLSMLRLNNKDTEFKPSEVEGNFGTISFGGKRGSNHKVMFYDKYEEQKKLFSKNDVDNTEEERKAKKKFWQKNSELYKNVVRFEIQYNSKFMLSRVKNYKYSRGVKMLENVINICATNWVEILKRFDQQLNTLNNRDEEDYQVMDEALNKLESLQGKEGISRTKCANLQYFLCSCHKKGWKTVWEEMGKQNFGVKYREILKLCNFDVKRQCLASIPIMRIMKTNGYRYLFESNFRFYPGVVREFDMVG